MCEPIFTFLEGSGGAPPRNRKKRAKSCGAISLVALAEWGNFFLGDREGCTSGGPPCWDAPTPVTPLFRRVKKGGKKGRFF